MLHAVKNLRVKYELNLGKLTEYLLDNFVDFKTILNLFFKITACLLFLGEDVIQLAVDSGNGSSQGAILQENHLASQQDSMLKEMY